MTRTRRRGGFSLLEITIALLLSGILLYVMVSAIHLIQMHVVAGDLAYAVQGGAVLSSVLEDDLRQAIRDGRTGEVLVQPEAQPEHLHVSFYRGVLREKTSDHERDIARVPVRWTFKSEGSTWFLERTTWSSETKRWVRSSYRAYPLVPPGDAERPGFVYAGDHHETDLQTIVVTALARSKRGHVVPGGAQDTATVHTSVHVPRVEPEHASEIYANTRTIDELFAEAPE